MMFVPENCSFYVLAGGQSSRFGSNKAIAEVDGSPLVLHAARPFDDVTAIGNGSCDYSKFGLRTIHDRLKDHGPCGGIARALEDARTDWIFIAPCDVTGFQREWLEPFVGLDTDAIAFYGDRWFPLFSAFRKSAKDAVDHAADSEGSVRVLLESLSSVKVPIPEGWTKMQRWDTR